MIPDAGKPPSLAADTGIYDESGVDLSLIRFVLSLSPLERLKYMERRARETRILNEYARQHRQAGDRADR